MTAVKGLQRTRRNHRKHHRQLYTKVNLRCKSSASSDFDKVIDLTGPFVHSVDLHLLKAPILLIISSVNNSNKQLLPEGQSLPLLCEFTKKQKHI